MPFTAEKLGDFCEGCNHPIVPGDRVAGGPFPKPFYHIACWPTESLAPPVKVAPRYELELATTRKPPPDRWVVKVICPRGTNVTQAAKVIQRLEEYLRMSDPRE